LIARQGLDVIDSVRPGNHRRTSEDAQRFGLGRLVLKNVPVLDELALFEAHDIGGDP
jgi:hypothetical protein